MENFIAWLEEQKELAKEEADYNRLHMQDVSFNYNMGRVKAFEDVIQAAKSL